jgi:hypothetical protein
MGKGEVETAESAGESGAAKPLLGGDLAMLQWVVLDQNIMAR